MFSTYQLTAEIVRQRHTEMLRSAERHHRLFRRPLFVEPVRPAVHPTATAHGAPVIALPTPRSSDHSPEARVA